MLHTLHDGSALRIMGAKELVRLPVWNGNRIIDNAHVQRIKDALGHKVQKLDFGYRIVTYDEVDAGGNLVTTSCIIDGQHRHRVLYDFFQESLCEPDFTVVVLEKKVKCEAEIIVYFKELNNQMPILWKTDPNMLANEYIKALIPVFNVRKDLIRPKSTVRPYLSVEKLREVLVAFGEQLKESSEEIKSFVARVLRYNAKALEDSDVNIALSTKKGQAEIIQRAADQKFMLAVDPRLLWVGECLK
jgi:hypothetical protein